MFNDDPKLTDSVLESISRLSIKYGVATIVLVTCPGSSVKVIQQQYRKVFSRYGIPVLSYHDLIQEEIIQAPYQLYSTTPAGSNKRSKSGVNSGSVYWPADHPNSVHPGCPPHRFIFEYIFNYLERMYNNMGKGISAFLAYGPSSESYLTHTHPYTHYK